MRACSEFHRQVTPATVADGRDLLQAVECAFDGRITAKLVRSFEPIVEKLLLTVLAVVGLNQSETFGEHISSAHVAGFRDPV